MKTASFILVSRCNILVANSAPLLRRGLMEGLSNGAEGYSFYEARSLTELLNQALKVKSALVITAPTCQARLQTRRRWWI